MRIPKEYLNDFNSQTDDIIETANKIAVVYTEELDECIEEVNDLLKNKDDLTIDQLNYYISIIPIYLYRLTDTIQDLGVKTDAAKMQRKNQYFFRRICFGKCCNYAQSRYNS